MMNRRGFLGRLTAGLAGAALAVNLELRSLVPVLALDKPKEIWYYLVEETRYGFHGKFAFIYWVNEDELPRMGLKPEDFADRWEDVPPVEKIPAYGVRLTKTGKPFV